MRPRCMITILVLVILVGKGNPYVSQSDAEQYQKDLVSFLEWATVQGIQHQDRFRVANVGEAGQGLLASRDFGPDELLLEIPEKAMFSPDFAMKSAAGKAFAEAGLPGCSATSQQHMVTDDCMQLLVTTLLYESNDPASYWAPWLKILPRKLSTPLFWTADELELLEGSNTQGLVESWKAYIQRLYDPLDARLFSKRRRAFPRAAFSRANFTWAFSTVYARAFDVDRLRGGARERVRLMAPLADLFNHGNVSSSYSFSPDASLLRLYAGQRVGAGEEVLLNYDAKPNADLLLQYGFVVADNPADGVGLVAALPPAAPGADAKRALLAELGSRPGTGRGGRHLLTRAGLAPLSESALRVLCATPEELAASHARRALRGKAVSAENDACVWRTMVQAIRGLLEKYPDSLVEDEGLLSGGARLSRNARTAVVLRRDEKRILLLNLARYQRRLDASLEHEKEHSSSGTERVDL